MRNPIKITFITTTNHNIGDDFVREGILFLLEEQLGQVATQSIHKHLPITVRNEWEWLHSTGLLSQLAKIRPGLPLRASRAIDLLPVMPQSDKIYQAEILVQSGAPIFWKSESGSFLTNEWWKPLIERRLLKVNTRPIFLNLAGGTCQHFNSDGSELCDDPAIQERVRWMHSLASVTTARDILTQKIFASAQCDVPLIPCSSLFAVDRSNVQPTPGEYVVMNFMKLGGHYDFLSEIDSQRWQKEFLKTVAAISKDFKILMVCHTPGEVHDVQRILPGVATFFSKNYQDYLPVFAKAKFGIVNRIHAAFVLASLGKPSVVIGNDTRAHMCGLLGIPYRYVRDTTEDWILSNAHHLAKSTDLYSQNLNILKTETRNIYNKELRHLPHLLANSKIS